MNLPTVEASTLSVLVVDDDSFSRDVMREMLTAEGIVDIQMADSGYSAMRALENLPVPPQPADLRRLHA